MRENVAVKYRLIVGQASLVLLLLIVALTRDVHAYLDPGTGSLVFQTVVAALAAAAYALRSYWGRIRTLFSRRRSRQVDDSVDRV